MVLQQIMNQKIIRLTYQWMMYYSYSQGSPRLPLLLAEIDL